MAATIARLTTGAAQFETATRLIAEARRQQGLVTRVQGLSGMVVQPRLTFYVKTRGSPETAFAMIREAVREVIRTCPYPSGHLKIRSTNR